MSLLLISGTYSTEMEVESPVEPQDAAEQEPFKTFLETVLKSSKPFQDPQKVPKLDNAAHNDQLQSAIFRPPLLGTRVEESAQSFRISRRRYGGVLWKRKIRSSRRRNRNPIWGKMRSVPVKDAETQTEEESVSVDEVEAIGEYLSPNGSDIEDVDADMDENGCVTPIPNSEINLEEEVEAIGGQLSPNGSEVGDEDVEVAEVNSGTPCPNSPVGSELQIITNETDELIDPDISPASPAPAATPDLSPATDNHDQSNLEDTSSTESSNHAMPSRPKPNKYKPIGRSRSLTNRIWSYHNSRRRRRPRQQRHHRKEKLEKKKASRRPDLSKTDDEQSVVIPPSPIKNVNIDKKRQTLLRVGGGKTGGKPSSNWLWVYRLKRRLCRGNVKYFVKNRRNRNVRKATVPTALVVPLQDEGSAIMEPEKDQVDLVHSPNLPETTEENRHNEENLPGPEAANSIQPGNENEKASGKKSQTLYKCPFCFLIYASGDGLIQHLPSHSGPKGNPNDTNHDGGEKQFDGDEYNLNNKRGRKGRPKKSQEEDDTVPITSMHDNEPNQMGMGMHLLRPCKIVLIRCDHLVQTDAAVVATPSNTNCSEIKSSKRKAGVQARSKMLAQILEEGSGGGEDLQVSKKPDKSHTCPTCSKVFTKRRNLKQHLITHSSQRSHKCPRCPKRFHRVYNIKRHLRIHTGERAHECPTCFKRFIEKEHLKKHLLMHMRMIQKQASSDC